MAELERTVERLNQGIVVTYELRAETDDALAVDLQQSLPPELTVADVGFRTDAAPAEWTVEGDTVRGNGTVPGEGTVEYVLGLKLPEAPDELPTFPEPELTEGGGSEADDGGVDDSTAEDDDSGGRETTDPSEIDLEGAEESTDGPSLVGNTDGALAESVREVIAGSEPDDTGASTDQPSAPQGDTASTTGATATDGGPGAADTVADPEQGPAPRQTPAASDELEAAVAAVEPELDESSPGEEAATEEPPELDLSIPEVGDGATETDPEETAGDDETDATGTDAEGMDTGRTGPTGTGGDAGEPDEESVPEPTAVSEEQAEPSAGAAPDTGAPEADISGLADRLAAADEADRRAVQEALGLDEVEDDGPSGTVTVRLEKLESRLSAFEAYEDALAEFIDGTGTVEEIEATATEAVEATDELRTEVAGLREEVEAAREAVEAAESERAALREDLDALRGDVDEALGLRQQLLGALQNAGGAAGTEATTTDGRARSPNAEE